MIDETRARGLQAMYAAGAMGALVALREECAGIAWVLLTKQLRTKKLYLPEERKREIAEDAAARLIERFLADKNFRVRRFTKYIGYRICDELFVQPKHRQKTFENGIAFHLHFMDILSMHASEFKENIKAEDPIHEIADSHKWGKKTVADLCRSRSYRQAIRRISAYVERRWIYDHAEALHSVYKALHCKTGAKGRVSRTGLGAVRRELLQGGRNQRERIIQRSGQVVER